MGKLRVSSVMLKVVSDSLYDLPCAPNLSVFWNFGSLLGVCLVGQIFSGLLLAMHYTPCSDLAFASVVHIMRDVNYGWMIRLVHANGASLFFVCMYIHIGRGLYYGSYKCLAAWMVGVTMLLVSMAIAFMGYVLPWGQMSYWGVSVITNLFSVVPVVGKDLVEWMWGGFTVCNATLQRFFVFHFVLPFVLACLGVIHLVHLHGVGGGNPLGVDSAAVCVPFHPYYSSKDLTGILVGVWFLFLVCCFCPFCLMDPSNFIPANSMVTPAHIQPEWYFLFAYSILRAVPSKGGGVVALLMSVGVLYVVPCFHWGKFRVLSYYPVNQALFWCFVGNFMFLSWLGSCPVEEPFVVAGQVSSVMFFIYFFLSPAVMKVQDLFLEFGR